MDVLPDDFGLDRALDVKDAIKRDKLNRAGFARQVVNALKPLSARSSIVVSIEGAWGSGKSSLLAMAEELFGQEPDKPVIVHFNPWLVGDRNALLQQFLSSLSKGLKLVDLPRVASKVAKEIKKYSAVLDLAKFAPIPGAEAIATATKKVIDAAASGAKQSTEPHDIEAQKHKVEEALKKFPRRVVVLIDDMDRLYPTEVFEMIRIIKAVADLPNVGYILAFDASYVTDALSASHVPKANAYLDKIVQTRLAIPVLSSSAKRELMQKGLSKLPSEATRSYFEGDEDLLAIVYHSGLRDVLEQPRDFARLFNVVNALEPELRGEIVLADIIGLAALITKASPVFELLRRLPKAFVGHLPDEISETAIDEVIKSCNKARAETYAQTELPGAVQRLVHVLFTQVAKQEGRPYAMQLGSKRGRLAQSARLVVALQFALTGADVSFRQARQFIEDQNAFDDIAATLTEENSQDFLELLADSVSDYRDLPDGQASELAVRIARLVETGAFVEARRHRQALQVPAQNTAIMAIRKLASTRGSAFIQQIAKDIACDEQALTVAAELAIAKTDKDDTEDEFFVPEQYLEQCRSAFIENILQAITAGKFFDKLNPGLILWRAAKAVRQRCPAVMSALRDKNYTLDDFALAFFASTFSSDRGQSYAMPRDIEHLVAFDKQEVLEQHARQRLEKPEVEYPVRAAWRCVVEGKAIYADGSDAT